MLLPFDPTSNFVVFIFTLFGFVILHIFQFFKNFMAFFYSWIRAGQNMASTAAMLAALMLEARAQVLVKEGERKCDL